jgi:catechol 1,2-dioxygenase
MTSIASDPPATVDPALINPRAVRLVEAFKDAVIRMRDEHGLTFDDLDIAATLLQQVHEVTGTKLSFCVLPLFSEILRAGDAGYTPFDDVDSPTYVPGSPLIDNPGTLPMRHDEPGTPLIASGRVLDGHGRPLAGAELTIYHASADGVYSGPWDDGLPEHNLRARQLTDAEGCYAFTTITPAAYSNLQSEGLEAVVAAAAALGRSIYRPAHIHYEIHHPDLLRPFTGEIYFSVDPIISIDVLGPKFATPSLQAITTLHNDRAAIAAHGFDGPFNTAVFDFIVKTRTSPATAVRPYEMA